MSEIPTRKVGTCTVGRERGARMVLSLSSRVLACVLVGVECEHHGRWTHLTTCVMLNVD